MGVLAIWAFDEGLPLERMKQPWARGNSTLWPRDGINNRGTLGEGWARLEGITEYA